MTTPFAFKRAAQIKEFISSALECSAYVAPTEFGLTLDELLEVASRTGFGKGEVEDAVSSVASLNHSTGRLLPETRGIWTNFHFRKEPDYRDFAAFEFVLSEFHHLTRAEGLPNARLGRAVIVERAVAAGKSRAATEAALTVYIHEGQLIESDGIVRLTKPLIMCTLPSEQRAQASGPSVIGKDLSEDERRKVYRAVEDVVERRADGRPKVSEALDAFPETLASLGYAPFRGWWIHTLAELRLASPSHSPTTVSVLSAALVEGCLTFVVAHARSLRVGPMGSNNFSGSPTTWKLDDLVSSASGGGPHAILDQATRARADKLIRSRQRIHAGRMLVDHPNGVPDLRPEEAREAVATAELVVRAVMDWVTAHPKEAHGSSAT